MFSARLGSLLAYLRARPVLGRIAERTLFPAIALILLTVIWGTTLHLIWLEHGVATRAAAGSTRELADTYEAQMIRALRDLDQTLKLVRYVHASNNGVVDFDDLGAKGVLPTNLLFAVSVADVSGAIVARSRPDGLQSVSGEPFFEELRRHDVVAVSSVAVDPRDGEAKVRFARRLEARNRIFAGAVIITAPAAYFVSGYETAKLGQQGLLGMLGSDGVFRARRTGDTVRVGERADFAAIIRGGPEEAVLNTTPLDNVRRYTIAREIFDFPLAVVVGLSESEQLAPVSRRAENYVWRAAGGSALLLLFLGALWGLSWQLTRTRVRANLALQEQVAIRRHAETALHLRNRAIESSVNAIVITDAARPDHPIEYVNPAFERITGYTPAETVGRSTRFLLGTDAEQAGAREIERAMKENREAHAVLRSYRRDGTAFWNEYFTAPVRNEAGEVTHHVGVMNDVTEAKQYEEQLAHQANFDALTGLANRNLLHDRLQQAIVGARREGRAVATVFLDIDNFKLVNDSLGHRVGDELLQTVAARLKACVRESDTVARLGGDEFVLVLQARVQHETGLEADISAVMNKLLANISKPLTLGGRDLRPTCSIGVSIYPRDGDTADMLLRNADAAMYRAKELGRNRFQLFTMEVHDRIRRRIELESSLRAALEREEFELHYQPQVSLRTGAIVAMEALLRWRHPQKGLIGPASFIGFAEETGLIVPIGAWVLRQACAQNKAWQDAGLPRIPVAVNMSAKQCEQPDIERLVREVLADSRLEARYLELEITESISMSNPEQSVPLMERLKAAGVSLSIDDFGTGFSNLSYLPRFPIDRLKIDLSFVRQMTDDAGSLAISEAIIRMSHSLDLEVIAEGVENTRQLELLHARRCDLVQGYLFSPPLPAAELATLLAEGRTLQVPAPIHQAPPVLM